MKNCFRIELLNEIQILQIIPLKKIMKQKINFPSQQQPSKKLRNFLSSCTSHLKSSSEYHFQQIKNNLTNLKQTNTSQAVQKEKFIQDSYFNHKQSLKGSSQVRLPQKMASLEQEKSQKSKGIGKMFSFIKEKQHSSYKQLVQNLKSNEQKYPQPQKQIITVQSPVKQENKLENNTNKEKAKESALKSQDEMLEVDIHKNLQQKPSSMEQVEQFCNTLREQYHEKMYNKDWVAQFSYNLEQIVANNAYICVQDTFQLLKKYYYPQHNSTHQLRPKQNNNSSSRNNLDTLQFNLQLTIKSRNPKNFLNFDARDSLTYSNATSFGLQSTQNRSKPLNKNDVSTKFLPPSNSQRSMKSKDLNETDIAQIQRTQSRGQVSRQNSRQQTPILRANNRKTQGLLTEDEKQKNFTDNQTSLNRVQTAQKQQSRQEVIPSTQQIKHQDKQDKAKKNKQQDTNKSPRKNSFSINKFTDRLKLSRNSTSKKLKDQSLFANQISNFQGKISRIKQAKLAKKIQLQEELKKINNEIEQLKVQEPQQNNEELTKRTKSPKSKPKTRQNTLESRIQINDNLQKKKQALNLVRNLKAQKISRENEKRRKFQVINTDLHQQIEDIMRLKYFNEQRVKQKKKLQIIERMKQQQMRKIEQQKRKHESLQFLAKLKGAERQKAIRDSQRQKDYHKPYQNNINQAKSYERMQQDQISQSPNKISRTKQQLSEKTPLLQKKKAYLSQRRNLNLIKKKNGDKYEQVLG